MIIDKLENLGQYVALNPRFKEVIAFINQHDLTKLDNGRHAIDGDKLFVNVEDDKGKLKEEAVIEYHRRMIDIQVPLNITETYGYTPVADLKDVPFDEERDIAKQPDAKPRNYVTLNPGEFAIFFPQDGHAPCIADGTLHKAVFKVEKCFR
jgi:YhcH/YjgK/YiaL family protein